MQLFLHHEELLTTSKYVIQQRDQGIVSKVYLLHLKEYRLLSKCNETFITLPSPSKYLMIVRSPHKKGQLLTFMITFMQMH